MTNGNKVRIAVPSVSPGGLNAVSSGHFGHCEQFTIINVEDQKIMSVDVIDNVSHVQGGCMVPVNLLAENRVQVLLVNGIGMRPLMGFQQAGIKIALFYEIIPTSSKILDACLWLADINLDRL